MTTTRRAVAALSLAALALLGACTLDKDNGADKNRESEQSSIATGFERVTRSQQIPVFDWSQERQTLLDVLTVRAEGTHGTAEVTALDGTLLWWCPTAGAPIPSTYQLSNPDQVVTPGPRERGTATVAQGEPTGVYTGASEATWVLCLDDNGNAFAKYDEAQVRWTAGTVSGLPSDKRARVDEITFEFTTESPG